MNSDTLGIAERAELSITITGIELVALKKLSLVSHALAQKLDGAAAREQVCLAGVLDGLIRQIDLGAAQPSARSTGGQS